MRAATTPDALARVQELAAPRERRRSGGKAHRGVTERGELMQNGHQRAERPVQRADADESRPELMTENYAAVAGGGSSRCPDGEACMQGRV
jgi:hypothetical protein